VKKSLLAVIFSAGCALALQGCTGGEITAQQQRDKKAELQRVADEHPDPNRQVRPQ
jgi:hypothetical protein